MTNNNYDNSCKCNKCYWASQCGDKTETACDDYTPLSTCPDLQAYHDDLEERQELYSELVRDYADSSEID